MGLFGIMKATRLLAQINTFPNTHLSLIHKVQVINTKQLDSTYPRASSPPTFYDSLQSKQHVWMSSSWTNSSVFIILNHIIKNVVIELIIINNHMHVGSTLDDAYIAGGYG